MNVVKCMFVTLIAMILFGCGESEQQQMVKQAQAIEAADECHVCGMVIKNYPGPKGQAYQKGEENTVRFCSTRDMFSYLLQPENQRQIEQIFVHDMSKTPWQKPEDDYFIDGKLAWYVIGSTQKGAMGKTLASFSKQSDADFFSEQFGGKVYKFDEITIDLL
ncbi:nitrous oxide reductase accessory protein NosL [Vibrio mediterranei]|uniref:nitrous oxide reductase accessory protein NosL n=1 Tax=Vibrio mediterranei TaxID=689 RepID=UPI00148E15B9|nr:nitrous oxide reductase accessory protein NosL [Vibrio mediterranei]NOI25011.1 nitrous oxide reductase accessory protein NosL [Vibrio mediterranei]